MERRRRGGGTGKGSDCAVPPQRRVIVVVVGGGGAVEGKNRSARLWRAVTARRGSGAASARRRRRWFVCDCAFVGWCRTERAAMISPRAKVSSTPVQLVGAFSTPRRTASAVVRGRPAGASVRGRPRGRSRCPDDPVRRGMTAAGPRAFQDGRPRGRRRRRFRATAACHLLGVGGRPPVPWRLSSSSLSPTRHPGGRPAPVPRPPSISSRDRAVPTRTIRFATGSRPPARSYSVVPAEICLSNFSTEMWCPSSTRLAYGPGVGSTRWCPCKPENIFSNPSFSSKPLVCVT